MGLCGGRGETGVLNGLDDASKAGQVDWGDAVLLEKDAIARKDEVGVGGNDRGVEGDAEVAATGRRGKSSLARRAWRSQVRCWTR